MCIDAAAGIPSPVAHVDAPDGLPAFFARPLVDRLIALRARCYDPRGSYTELFHSDDPVDIARAKAICSRCVVREPCLARAVERAEPCGVWGGEIFLDGAVVPYRPRRGRRPKNHGTPLIVDEVSGIPVERKGEAFPLELGEPA